MVFTAPAKLNLYLKIVEKYSDGYHGIETLFERISIFDRISVDISDGETAITASDPSIPLDDSSLMGKTISFFREKSGIRDNFRVHIEKNIPQGAGMGGGSSDAATLLKALNELTGKPLDHETMVGICRDLGADVAFFLEDCSFAYGKGRGDIINKIGSELNFVHVVVSPPFFVSTKEIYGKVSPFNLTKDRGVDRMFSTFLKEKDMPGLLENLRNDLQIIALQDFPVLRKVISLLEENGSGGTLMSGSGGTVFGIFDRDLAYKAAENVKKRFSPAEGWKIFTAETY